MNRNLIVIPQEIQEYGNYIYSLIEKSDDRNPLKISLLNKTAYYTDFIDCMIHIHKELSDKECDAILIDKLQLSRNDYDEDKYYEAATEFSVILHTFCIKHSAFDYEESQNKGITDKNPECSVVSTTGNKFIVEAKCPVQAIENFEMQTGQTFIFKNAGHAESLQEQKKFLKTMNDDLATQNASVVQGKCTDNKMLDFLQSASQKFSLDNNANELNILFVALDSVNQIQDWVNYFYFNKGFFTTNSFAADEPYCYADRKTKETYVEPHFKNVHFVVFTNNYYRHKNNSVINGSAWYLCDGFNIALQNPFVNMEDKKETIVEYFTYLGVYTKDIQNYDMPCSPNIQKDVLDAIKITSFVKAEVEEKQGVYYWDIPKVDLQENKKDETNSNNP